MLNRVVVGFAIFMGLAQFASGAFMTVAPESWYWMVPGVSDRGPFNQHFVRDIGINFLLIGAAFMSGAVYLKHRIVLWLIPTMWLGGHALFHVWEVFAGVCGPESLIEDFAGVTVPALLGLALVVFASRQAVNE